MKRTLKFICITMLGALVFAACGSKTDTPKNVVNEYYSQFKSGNFKKALSLTTKTDEEIKQDVAKLEGFKLDVKSYEILSEEIAEDGNSAKVKVKFTATSTMDEKGKEQTETVRLEKIDGVWKIK